MEVLFMILIALSAGVTATLAKFLDDKLPEIRQPFGFFLIIFLGVFGFGVFVLLTWILEWINF